MSEPEDLLNEFADNMIARVDEMRADANQLLKAAHELNEWRIQVRLAARKLEQAKSDGGEP